MAGFTPQENYGYEHEQENSEPSLVEYEPEDVTNNVRDNAVIYSEIDIENNVKDQAEDDIEESEHVYNSLDKDNVQYETLKSTHRDEIFPDNVYNHVTCNNKVESEYDLTKPRKVRGHTETDHVYNTLTSESDEYGHTKTLTGSKMSGLEDGTYNTLNLK